MCKRRDEPSLNLPSRLTSVISVQPISKTPRILSTAFLSLPYCSSSDPRASWNALIIKSLLLLFCSGTSLMVFNAIWLRKFGKFGKEHFEAVNSSLGVFISTDCCLLCSMFILSIDASNCKSCLQKTRAWIEPPFIGSRIPIRKVSRMVVGSFLVIRAYWMKVMVWRWG